MQIANGNCVALQAFTARFGLLCVCLLLATIRPSSAAIVYTSAGFDDVRTCDPVSCTGVGSLADARDFGFEAAASFQLGSDSILTGVAWIGEGPNDNEFRLRLYRSIDGSPAFAPFYEYVLGSSFVSSPLEFPSGVQHNSSFSGDIAPVALPGDELFFVSIQTSLDSTGPLNWSWAAGSNTPRDDRFARRAIDGPSWHQQSWYEQAFQFVGEQASIDVAEPASFGLLAMGLAVFGFCQRRARASQ